MYMIWQSMKLERENFKFSLKTAVPVGFSYQKYPILCKAMVAILLTEHIEHKFFGATICGRLQFDFVLDHTVYT